MTYPDWIPECYIEAWYEKFSEYNESSASDKETCRLANEDIVKLIVRGENT